MHNLPVLWLVVGLLSLCHAPVPIVGQLEMALLLCVVHAVQCAVSVPGFCVAGSNGSRCGRVRESCSALGRSLAIQVGVASHGTKAADNKKVLAALCLCLSHHSI